MVNRMFRAVAGAGIAAAAVVIGLTAGGSAGLADAPPQVVVSIKPVHALVAAVMEGAATPTLLIPSGASPHTYSLKPSDARALQDATLIFWVGEGLEAFLAKPLRALPQNARIIALSQADAVTLLPYRVDGPGDDHDHDHGHAPGAHHAHEAHGDDHGHGAVDLHIWLDTGNAMAIVAAAAAALADADPQRADLYAANAERTVARLQALDGELRAALTPLAGRPYIVFHDAYQYLEHRYGLKPAGAITVSPDRQPSAQRVSAIRATITGAGAVCVFSEPQFEPALVRTLIDGTGVRTGVLDADGGVGVPPGPDAYFTLMRNLGRSLKTCLAPAS